MTQHTTRSDFDRYMIPMFAPAPFIPVKGEGSSLYDQDGKHYIDFAGGIAVNVLGHADPDLRDILKQQADALWHVGNGYTNEPVLDLARQLVESTFADKVFFCNSGAEANEAALKLARKYALDKHGAHKNQIVAFNHAFHGRTLFTVSAGGQPKYSQDFAPLPGGITHVDYNDLEAAKAVINEQTCAVIVEPVQGEGGVIPAQAEFLQGLRQLCNQHDVVLIFDEVQTGVGRTGHLYAYMHYEVTPDVLSTAKALGGGFPIGGILTIDKFAPALSVGTHGTTYGGNPLASAVANTVLSKVNQTEFFAQVQIRHQQFVARLNQFNQDYSLFKQVRGIGLLIGCELKDEHQGQAKQISNLAAKHGAIILIAGPNVVRFAPALNITEDEMNTGLDRFEQALQEYIKSTQ